MKNYVKEYKGRRVPEGATHYGERNPFYPQDCFYRNNGSEVFVIDEWRKTLSNREDLVLLPEAQSEWDGKGLPSLNSEVLLSDEEGYLFSSASNEKVSIADDEVLIVVSIGARHDNGNPVVTLMAKDSKNLQGFVTVNPEFLEPLKTQEQKDREAFIDKVMTGTSIDVKSAPIVHNIAEQLFEAGFKAPEGD